MEAITKLAINNPLGNDKLYVDSVLQVTLSILILQTFQS